MTDRLFDLDEIPEVPILPEPRRRKGAAAGSWSDERFKNDYPASWHRCESCEGRGVLVDQRDLAIDVNVLLSNPPQTAVTITHRPSGFVGAGAARSELRAKADAYAELVTILRLRRFEPAICSDCDGMGSLKAMVRFHAGHRCVRCRHPYMPKGDAKMLGVEATPFRWSPCDDRCRHSGPMRVMTTQGWSDFDPTPEACGPAVYAVGQAEAEWRILTVHHLDGDKANCRWWNLAALCQRCHLEIQGKVVMERVYPLPHSEWFRPYVAGYYAFVYLGEELTRSEVESRMDELLALELAET